MEATQLLKMTELRLIAPLIVVSIVSIVVLMLEAFHKTKASRRYLAWVSVLGLALAGLDTFYLLSSGTSGFAMGHMLFVDGFSLVFNLVILVAAVFATLISPAFLASHRLDRGEYYVLLLISTVGMMLMTSAADLFVLFFGLEMMSIPIYAMASFFRHSSKSAESGMKYFILGAFASAIFLYGIALFYGITGTTNLVEISRIVFSGLGSVGATDLSAAQTAAANNAFVDFVGLNAHGVVIFKLTAIPAIALILILVALAFKVAAVPFHSWTPDVYSGAPSSAVGFMATGVKTAAFAALIRIFIVGFYGQAARISDTGWLNALFWLAMISIIVGNLVALVQKDVKRMLAYSAISHAGFMLVGVASASYSPELFHSMDVVVFYAMAYTFGTVGAFGVLAYFGKRGEECTTYDDLAGISKKYPGAALAMTIFMLSAAGIPPTAGFAAKFFVLRAAVQTGEKLFVILAVVAVLASVAGVYYYLKVVLSMYMKAPRREVRAVGGFEIKAALVACGTATLFLGLFPGSFMTVATQGIEHTLGLPVEVSTTLKSRALKSRLTAIEGVPAAASGRVMAGGKLIEPLPRTLAKGRGKVPLAHR